MQLSHQHVSTHHWMLCLLLHLLRDSHRQDLGSCRIGLGVVTKSKPAIKFFHSQVVEIAFPQALVCQVANAEAGAGVDTLALAQLHRAVQAQENGLILVLLQGYFLQFIFSCSLCASFS